MADAIRGDHHRARARPARGGAASPSAAPARCSARCWRDELELGARRRAAATPATSRPGACSAPTSPADASRTRVTRLLDDEGAGRGRRCSASCSPSSTRGGSASRDGIREVHARHALRRPGAHADDCRARRRRRASATTPEPVAERFTRRVRAHLRHDRWTRSVEIVSRARDRARRRCERAATPARQRRPPRRRRGRSGSVRRGRSPRGDWLEFAVVDRAALAPARDARRARRSCVEQTATTYVDARLPRRACIDSGALLIDRRGGDACAPRRSSRGRRGRDQRRRRRRPDHDRDHPPRPERRRRADEAGADAHVVLAGHLRGARLRRRALRPRRPPARAGADAARSSWAR